ncbi:enamine deaminase RidA (YjgF/YER057c/UK114 family) [Bradyrhizobium sp. S3.2.6]
MLRSARNDWWMDSGLSGMIATMPSCRCFARRVKRYFFLPEFQFRQSFLLCMGLFSRFLLEQAPHAATLAANAINVTSEIPMPIQHFAPPPHVKAPPLSFATRVGDLLFVSGIPGFDANGALPDGFEAQFANVVVNIKRVLDEAGVTTRDLAKVNVLLTRASDVAAMNALYAGAFGPPPFPARTTCVVQALPDPKMLIEIEAVASLAK